MLVCKNIDLIINDSSVTSNFIEYINFLLYL